jgi:hypothetical protein
MLAALAWRFQPRRAQHGAQLRHSIDVAAVHLAVAGRCFPKK